METIAQRLLAIAEKNFGHTAHHPATSSTEMEEQQDKAVVAIIMCAAAVESAVYVRLVAPALLIPDASLQKYFAEMATQYVRAPIHQRIAFLASVDPRLALTKEEKEVFRRMFTHRNRLVHSSLIHRELHYLPDDWEGDGEVQLEDLPKRGSLEFSGWSTEMITEAGEFLSAVRAFIARFESVPLTSNEDKPA